MKEIFCLAIGTCLSILVAAQSSTPDTVVVQLAKTSQLIFTVEDRNDIELLHHYDFQSLFNDILSRLEENDAPVADTIPANADSEEQEDQMDIEDNADAEEYDESEDYEEEYEDPDNVEEEDDESHKHKGRRNRFFGTGNIDFGINNYLEDLKFPDADGAQYTVRPWGSWYVALNSIYNIRITNSFKIESGFGISWYNFKYQDNRTVLTKDSVGVIFSRNDADYNFIKSKLTVAHINVSVVPMFEFGRYLEDRHWWKSHPRTFRIGAGVYAGYRIGSFTKQVYEIDGDKEKVRNHDNLYLNNIRYGVRLQFGIHETDFFVNYDLSELFVDGRGPKLNAYSFGIIF